MVRHIEKNEMFVLEFNEFNNKKNVAQSWDLHLIS